SYSARDSTTDRANSIRARPMTGPGIEGDHDDLPASRRRGDRRRPSRHLGRGTQPRGLAAVHRIDCPVAARAHNRRSVDRRRQLRPVDRHLRAQLPRSSRSAPAAPGPGTVDFRGSVTEIDAREVSEMPLLPPLVSPSELRDVLGNERVRVFDATVFLRRPPGGGPYTVESGRESYARAHVPGAGFADIP